MAEGYATTIAYRRKQQHTGVVVVEKQFIVCYQSMITNEDGSLVDTSAMAPEAVTWHTSRASIRSAVQCRIFGPRCFWLTGLFTYHGIGHHFLVDGPCYYSAVDGVLSDPNVGGALNLLLIIWGNYPSILENSVRVFTVSLALHPAHGILRRVVRTIHRVGVWVRHRAPSCCEDVKKSWHPVCRGRSHILYGIAVGVAV